MPKNRIEMQNENRMKASFQLKTSSTFSLSELTVYLQSSCSKHVSFVHTSNKHHAHTGHAHTDNSHCIIYFRKKNYQVIIYLNSGSAPIFQIILANNKAGTTRFFSGSLLAAVRTLFSNELYQSLIYQPVVLVVLTLE